MQQVLQLMAPHFQLR